MLPLWHLHNHLKHLVRDTGRLAVALEYRDSLAQSCTGSQRRVKLPRPKNEPCQLAHALKASSLRAAERLVP